MEISSQKQIGGDNSTLVQGTNITIGVSVQDVVEIFKIQFKNLLPELYNIAENKAKERLSQFEDIFYSKLEKLEKFEDAFTEPYLQYLIRDTQRSVICCNNENSYEVLSNLLIDSINNIKQGENNILIKQAIKVVGELDLVSLLFITNLYIIENTFPTSIDYKTGIKNYCTAFEPFILTQPVEHALLDSLELLDLIKYDYFYSKKDFYEYFYDQFDGYFKLGIQKSHANYEKALNLLSSINLVDNIFIDNPFYPEYSKISLITSRGIKELMVFADEQKQTTRIINNDEVKIIKQIYELYNNDDEHKKKEMLELIKTEFSKYPIMEKVKSIWDSYTTNCYLSSLGVLIGKNNFHNKFN